MISPVRLIRPIAVLSALFIVVVAVAEHAAAQEKPKYLLTRKQTKKKVDKCDCKPKKKKKPKKKSPWKFRLRLGSVFQLNSNRAVVGRRDGTTRTIGGDVHGEANWASNGHEVRNRLDINAMFIKTPNTRTWVSGADVFELENIYQYRAGPTWGPFTRVGLTTSLFVGRDLRTNSVQYQFPDGSLTEERTDLRLTDPLSPVTFIQTAGLYLNPVRETEFDLDIRVGAGAREVFAKGQLGVQDDADTPDIVEIINLRNYSQAGAELIVMARGVLFKKKVQYYFGGEFLLPLIRTKEMGDTRSSIDLIDKKIRLGIAYRIARWATLLYEIRLVHQPQLIDQYQIQNQVGFKASYSVL